MLNFHNERADSAAYSVGVLATTQHMHVCYIYNEV